MSLPTPYFQDESVTIYHADCRDILPELPKVDLVLTDPPYGIGLESHGALFKDARVIPYDNLLAFELACIVDTTYLDTPRAFFFSPFQPLPFGFRSILVWSKGKHVGAGGDRETCWKRDFELIGVADNKPLNGLRDSAILHFNALLPPPSGHVAEKPIALMRYLVLKLSQTGDLILDPFMGSGTTLVAAQALGRKSIGIEIEEKYCRIAVERLRQKPLPLTEPMSHDRLTVQGGLFDGTPTNRGDKAENLRGEQGQDTDGRGTPEAQRDTQEAISRGQTDDPLEGNEGQGHMESQREGFSIVEGRQVR